MPTKNRTTTAIATAASMFDLPAWAKGTIQVNPTRQYAPVPNGVRRAVVPAFLRTATGGHFQLVA